MWIVASIVVSLSAAPSPPKPPPQVVDSRYRSVEALGRYVGARLLEERGDGLEALDEYYRILSLDDRAASVARRVSEVAAEIGQPDRALEFANRSLELDPNSTRGHWLRGAALLRLERTAEALPELQEAAAGDSERVEYQRTLGYVAEREERLDLAARAYRRVVWLEEDDPEAWFQLGAAEARLGRFRVADSVIARAAALNPIRPGLLFLQGWIAERLGQRQRAIELYQQHLSVHTEDPMARRRLVTLLAVDGRKNEALQEAKKLTRLTPGDLFALQLEAELAFETGHASDGNRALERMARLGPDDPEVLEARVGIMGRHGQGRRAVEEAEAWRKRHPEAYEGLLVAARARLAAGQPDSAIRRLEDAIVMRPDSLEARVRLARLYQEQKQLDKAEVTWAEAARRFPKVSEVGIDLAFCRERRQDFPGAEKAVRDVLARDPDNAVALNFLGYLYADQGRNLEEALKLIQRALAVDPDNGAYIDSLGWVYYRMGRLEESRRHLERAVELTNGDPVVHEHLGDVYKDLQLNDLAKEQYRLSMAADGSNDRVKAKLGDLR